MWCDDNITGFDPDRALAALIASGADFFQGGVGDFQNIAGGDTAFDLQTIGTSDSLQNLVDLLDVAHNFLRLEYWWCHAFGLNTPSR